MTEHWVFPAKKFILKNNAALIVRSEFVLHVHVVVVALSSGGGNKVPSRPLLNWSLVSPAIV